MYKPCPRCGGFLCRDYDGWEYCFTCLNCARSYNLGGESIEMSLAELKKRIGITYQNVIHQGIDKRERMW